MPNSVCICEARNPQDDPIDSCPSESNRVQRSSTIAVARGQIDEAAIVCAGSGERRRRIHPVNIKNSSSRHERLLPARWAGCALREAASGISGARRRARPKRDRRRPALLLFKGADGTLQWCIPAPGSPSHPFSGHRRNRVGKAGFVRGNDVREGAVVIDVGINRVEDASAARGYRLVGDVAFDEVAPKTAAITPVPGGVGPMTIAMLMANTVKAAKLQK